MASTPSAIEVGLDEISARIQANSKRAVTGKSSIATAAADLTSMATAYTQLLADIDAMLAANPTNAALAVYKARKDLLVAEFLELQPQVQAMKDALDAL